MKVKEIASKIKAKICRAEIAVETAIGSAIATVCPAYATSTGVSGANTTVQNFFKFVFSLSKIAGAALIIFGLIKAAKLVQSYMAQDQQVQSGEIAKVMGLIVSGIVAVFIEGILGLMGIKVSELKFG